LPEDERDDDFEELKKTVAEHARAVTDRLEAIRRPKADNLMLMETGELIALVRQSRIEMDATATHMKNYNLWRNFVCTMKHPISKKLKAARVFDTLEELRFNAPDEVIIAINNAFADLEAGSAADRRGKG
jgi:hypothetical protein